MLSPLYLGIWTKLFKPPIGSALTKRINNHVDSHVFWLLDWFVFSLLDFCLFVDDERNNNQLWQTVQEQIGGCSGAGGRTSGTPAYIFFSSAPPQILVLVIFVLFMVLFQFAMVTKLAFFMCSSILPLGWRHLQIFRAQDHRLWKWAKLAENGQTSGQKAPISSRPILFSKSWCNDPSLIVLNKGRGVRASGKFWFQIFEMNISKQTSHWN